MYLLSYQYKLYVVRKITNFSLTSSNNNNTTTISTTTSNNNNNNKNNNNKNNKNNNPLSSHENIYAYIE